MFKSTRNFIAIRPEIKSTDINAFVQIILYIPKNQSDCFQIFSVYETSNMVFQIFIFFHEYRKVITSEPEVCEMGEYFRLQNGPNLLCRAYPCSPNPKKKKKEKKKKRCMPWSRLDAL